MNTYKYASGAEKRKRRKLQEQANQRLPKITSFFVSNDINDRQAEEGHSNPTCPLGVDDDERKEPDEELTLQSTENDERIDGKHDEESADPVHTQTASIANFVLPRISEWTTEMMKSDQFMEKALSCKPKSDDLHEVGKIKYTDGQRTYYRKLNETDLYRPKLTRGSEKREWLIYDSKTNAVFCFPCKLFSNEKSGLTENGYNDWKNIQRTLKRHEESQSHLRATVVLTTRSTLRGTINTQLQQQLEDEVMYWTRVLRRVIATVRFLAQQGLPFRGSTENFLDDSRGNYLSALLYLAEFDPFLAEHIRRYGNPGKGSVSYLSHHICDEFIQLLRDKLIAKFVSQIKTAQYYSIIVDSTPDISHTDQLSFILRYVYDGQVIERFMGFLKIDQHSAEYLHNMVLTHIENLSLDIAYCRGQSYDNAANMSGKYTGLQARIKSMSPTAVYIPCTNHSLNLVVNFACESSLEAIEYFGLIQNVYVFFASSTMRWQRIKDKCKSVPKRLSDTRWSARYDALKALKDNFKTIRTILSDFAEDRNEKSLARQEAFSISTKLQNFENVFLTVIWSKLLERINATSKTLEDPSIDLSTGVRLLQSLVTLVTDFRNRFDELEHEAMQMAETDPLYRDSTKRTRRRKLFADDTRENEIVLVGRNNFRVNIFYFICDSLSQELNRRLEAYSEVHQDFNCFYSEDENEVDDSISRLSVKYATDIEKDNLREELYHFRNLCKNIDAKTMYQKYEQAVLVSSTFPNVLSLLQIFLTIPLSNASAERSFSSLKRIRNYQRATIGQDRLDALSLLYIENDSMNLLQSEELIKDFANKKARKRLVH